MFYLSNTKYWIIIISTFITSQLCWALNFKDLKGFQENLVLSPAFEYLHPFHGASFAHLGLLINIYNYPNSPANAKFDSKNKQWDPTEQFIQSIFNVPPGTDSTAFLQVSPLAKKCGKFLGPSAIGLVLSELHPLNEQKETQNIEPLSNRLFDLIQSDSEFQHLTVKAQKDSEGIQFEMDQLVKDISSQFQSDLTQLKQAIEEVESRKRTLAKERFEYSQSKDEELLGQVPGLDNQIKTLFSEINTLKIRLTELESKEQEALNNLYKTPKFEELRKKKSFVDYKPQFLRELLFRLLAAWKNEGTNNSIYPNHFTEQVLIAIAWMNTPDHEKRHFLELYERVQHDHSNAIISINNENHASWLDPAHIDHSFSSTDLENINKILLSLKKSDRIDYIKRHPDHLALHTLGRKFFSKDFIPELGFKQVNIQNGSGQNFYFSDCMESSLLNFIAIITRGPNNSIDLTVFQGPIKPSPVLQDFLKKFNSIDSLDLLSAHNAWAQLVSFGREIGLKYVNKEGYELETDIDNLLYFLRHHLFPTLDDPLKTPRSQVLDQLCQLVSNGRTDFHLEWELKSSDKKTLDSSTRETIIFRINDEPEFRWKIKSDHSEVNSLEYTSEKLSSFDFSIAETLSKEPAALITSLIGKLQIYSQFNFSLPSFQGNKNESVLLETAIELNTIVKKKHFVEKQKKIAPLKAARILHTFPPDDPSAQVILMEILRDTETIIELAPFHERLALAIQDKKKEKELFDTIISEVNIPALIWLLKKTPQILDENDLLRFVFTYGSGKDYIEITSIRPDLLLRKEFKGNALHNSRYDLKIFDWLLETNRSLLHQLLKEKNSEGMTPIELLTAFINPESNREILDWTVKHVPEAFYFPEYCPNGKIIPSIRKQLQKTNRLSSANQEYLDKLEASIPEEIKAAFPI